MNDIIEGYWDSQKDVWVPFDCSFKFGPQRLDQLKEVLANEWILFFGDSNTRKLVQELCSILSLPFIGTSNHYLCTNSTITITYRTYWHKTLNIQEAYNETFDEFMTALRREVKSDIQIQNPPVRSCPTFVFLSIGSHSLTYVYQEMEPLQRQIDTVLPSSLRKERFSLLLITASNNRHLVRGLKRFAPKQVNPRIIEKNLATIETANLLEPPVPIMDFFSTTFVLAIKQKTQDAVHYFPLAYRSHLVYILDFISSRKEKNIPEICIIT